MAVTLSIEADGKAAVKGCDVRTRWAVSRSVFVAMEDGYTTARTGGTLSTKAAYLFIRLKEDCVGCAHLLCQTVGKAKGYMTGSWTAAREE